MKGKGHSGVKDVTARRREAVRVRMKPGRSVSSKRWLDRQLNDPYVAAAKESGYRSRAAFKLLQLDEKFHLLRQGQRVVDLGAAPGGWSQVVAAKIGKTGQIVALDILPMDPIDAVTVIHLDFFAPDAPGKLCAALNGKADIVLSDMAPPTTGHSSTDHLRIMAMAEEASAFAMDILAPGGTFVCKLFKGGAEKSLLDALKQNFVKVRHAKPPASRADSSESYIVAEGFRGVQVGL